MTEFFQSRSAPFRRTAHLIFLSLLLTSCNLPTPTPTVQPIVDAFFSGYAYLDVNGNGELDAEDTPVENATLIVTMQGGLEFGGATDASGYAFLVAPGGVDYPVTLRMEPPKDSTLKLIGPSSVTYPSDTPAKFLFSAK